MDKNYCFLAFDIGATSGRSIIGELKNGRLDMKELTRFPNKMVRVGDKFFWNIYSLYEALKEGLHAASESGLNPDAVGIDTWGVDFVYLGKDDSILGIPRSYRDPYTEGIPEEYFKSVSRREVYDRTGIQIMNFNTLFQLFAARKEKSSLLDAAENILFMPDALSFLLTGKKICEYTIASTSQMINPWTKSCDHGLLEKAGISPSLLLPLTMPGTIIGNVRESIMKECRLKGTIPVIAVGGHDTASAVAAVPAENPNFSYISSGTWSLMGVETDEPIVTDDSFRNNFTNEGGVDGKIRFLHNITGMWLLEQCRREWENEGKKFIYDDIVRMAESQKGFISLVNPDDASFANPESMTSAIISFCEKTNQKAPRSEAEFVRTIFDSLALKYKYVLDRLQSMAPFKVEKIHIIGGGSQNKLLNQFTANSTGLPVVAGPAEATAIGNIMMQAKGLGVVSSLHEIRQVIQRSVTPEMFLPMDMPEWAEAYMQFVSIMK